MQGTHRFDAYEPVACYQHPQLVQRLSEKLSLSRSDSEQLFADTKQFLFLCARFPGQLSPSESIDRGWHEFLLFTRDYDAFCSQHLGRFIHHQPHDDLARSSQPRGVYRLTLRRAQEAFGGLSKNWGAATSCVGGACSSDCSDPTPSTNCQNPD
jgi:hypothetical protein